MKLLFDQNLSPGLVALLADVFPGSMHVREAGLARATDDAVWRFALEHGFAIATRDSDFQERSQIASVAPKVVWIRRGNCSTREIESLFRKCADQICDLAQQNPARFLILF